MKRWTVFAVSALLGTGVGCSGHATRTGDAIIVVDAPFGKLGALAKQIEQGAVLAAEQINAEGGVVIDSSHVRLQVTRMDNDLSPVKTASNTRAAADQHAVAIIDEGTGVDASWKIALDAGIPIGIVYQGSESLVNVAQRHNVFRLTPSNRGIAFRLAEYLVPKNLRIAILHDDSTYGTGGAESLSKAFAKSRSSLAVTIRVPAGSTDLAPQILQARTSGASALIVWARPSIIALAIRAARSAGWNAPFFTPPAGSDPLVREQLADHPEWVEGLTVTGGRLTSEVGTKPFESFRNAYEKRFGAEQAGVRSNGKQVVVLPEQAMYSYDFVRIVVAAMRLSKSSRSSSSRTLVDAMENVAVQGANGDQRGFNPNSHEGVVDDDVFFSVCRAEVFIPVKDDPLSASLPAVSQTI